MKHFFASLVLIAALAPAAHAGGALKARIMCMTDDHKALHDGDKNALDHDILCGIEVDRGKPPDGTTATVSASVVSPVGTVGGPVRSAIGEDDGGGVLLYDPHEMFHHDGDFLKCAPVVFAAMLVKDGKTLWTGSMTIKPTCAAPKLDPKMGELSCSAVTTAGSVDFPGSGDKAAAEVHDMTCTVSNVGGNADAKAAAIAVHGGAANLRLLTTQPGAKTSFAFVQLLGKDIPKCKSFAVDAALTRTDGAVLWKASLPIKQKCTK